MQFKGKCFLFFVSKIILQRDKSLQFLVCLIQGCDGYRGLPRFPPLLDKREEDPQSCELYRALPQFRNLDDPSILFKVSSFNVFRIFPIDSKEQFFKKSNSAYLICSTSMLESVQDYLIKLVMKPCIHLVKISLFSLNHGIVRLTKIMKNLLEHLKIHAFKVIFLCFGPIFQKKNMKNI